MYFVTDYTEKCWVKERRDEREPEFAPPTLYQPTSSGKESNGSEKPKTYAAVAPPSIYGDSEPPRCVRSPKILPHAVNLFY